MSTTAELPKYKCHKEIWALQISGIQHLPNPDTTGKTEGESYGAIIIPAKKEYAAFAVSENYMLKHKPQVGGYYVVYKGGYESYSPAKALEDGYTLVN